jgi:hypothetical protein
MSSYEPKPTDADIATFLADFDATVDETSRPKRAKGNRRGRKTSVTHFRGQKKTYDTAKDGYVWMVNQFIVAHPALVTYAQVTETRDRHYIAASREDLFLRSRHLADISGTWQQLENGRYAITNLSAREMVDLLRSFGDACGLKFGIDWDFEVFDATEETSVARRRVQITQEMIGRALDDLDAME